MSEGTPHDREAEASHATEPTACEPYTLRELVMYFLRLGALGFGGPIALAGYMQRDLVERRRWISERVFLQGLALAQLAPGPLAAQLAIYIGWVRGGVLGGTLVGIAFNVVPFVLVVGLAVLYTQAGGLSWMQHAFYGIGAAVIAIIVRSTFKLVRMTVAKDRLLYAIFAVNAAVVAWTESEIAWIFLASGLMMLAIRGGLRPPRVPAVVAAVPLPWLVTGMSGPAAGKTLWQCAWYFAQSGAFVFGSGLAIVPFLYGGVVEQFGWLSEQQFLDAVAVAMITPGPVVITVAFIGYLVAGPLGAVIAAIGTFLPCWLFTVVPAPYYHRFADNRRLAAFITGVTAAATGAIAGAAIVLGRRAIFDLPTVAIAIVALGVLWKTRKVPDPILILAAGILGILIRGAA